MRSVSLSHFLKLGGIFLIAFVLAIFPLPGWTVWLKPEWVLLLLLYGTFARLRFVTLFGTLCVGLFSDLLQGTALGMHALAMVLLVYIATKFFQHFRFYPILQQVFIIAGLLFLYRSLLLIEQGWIGQFEFTFFYWLPVVTSALLWPWIAAVLQNYE